MLSVYFTRVTYIIEHKITKIKNYLYRGLAGGIMLAIIISAFPPIYGEGYGFIKSLLTETQSNFLLFDTYQISDPKTLPFWLFFIGIIIFKPSKLLFGYLADSVATKGDIISPIDENWNAASS